MSQVGYQEVVGTNFLHFDYTQYKNAEALIECIFESLILAQDERWRRALGMQVEWSGDQRSEVGIQICYYNS